MIPRGRWVAGLVAATVVVLGVDLSRPALTDPVREAAATVVGPVQRALKPDQAPRVTRLTQQRDELESELRASREQLRDARGEAALVRSPSARGRRLVPARVVATSAVGTPERTRRITLDVGARDGVAKDRTVISADGLVGRVVSVAPWTCDVLVLGDRDVTVGVRVGPGHRLGSVSSEPTPGLPPRKPGDLTLTLVGPGSVHVGDQVTTLGSVADRPFVPGVPVGTVTSVDPDHGQLGATAVVRPAVDPGSLDVVGVVLTTPRSTPRPAVTGAP